MYVAIGVAIALAVPAIIAALLMHQLDKFDSLDWDLDDDDLP
jgi:hypothetical protein